MRKPIVIIGGMGPQASLRFHELLIEKSAKHHDGQGDEFPFIVHFSLPVDDFISDESKKAAAISLLNQQEGVVEKLKPGTITLACNTAHLMVPDVPLLRQPNFVPLPGVVAARLAADGVKRAGVLATPTTLRTGLYDMALAEQGIKAILPTKTQHKVLEAAIRSVIAGRPDISVQTELVKIARSLVAKGAQAIILGCTELPLIFPSEDCRVPVLDCLDIYAEAVTERHYLYVY